jgi:hypothetical protein
MPPDNIYVLRALEYAELAEREQDFTARQYLRQFTLCWLRLAEIRQASQTSIVARNGDSDGPPVITGESQHTDTTEIFPS